MSEKTSNEEQYPPLVDDNVRKKPQILEDAELALSRLSHEKNKTELLLSKLKNNQIKWSFTLILLLFLGIIYSHNIKKIFNPNHAYVSNPNQLVKIENNINLYYLKVIPFYLIGTIATFSMFKIYQSYKYEKISYHKLEKANEIWDKLSNTISYYKY